MKDFSKPVCACATQATYERKRKEEGKEEG
jgi:hypothetical protein